MNNNLKSYIWPSFLFVLVSISAVYEIDLHYQNRELFKQYQSLIKQKDQQEVRWKELRIELSKVASGIGLENEASEKASMKLPDSSKIKIVVTDEKK
tara:strand:+ start:1256 stop:1546 length:291 start_codon:yes stop_codon:yes gene_type:complete